MQEDLENIHSYDFYSHNMQRYKQMKLPLMLQYGVNFKKIPVLPFCLIQFRNEDTLKENSFFHILSHVVSRASLIFHQEFCHKYVQNIYDVCSSSILHPEVTSQNDFLTISSQYNHLAPSSLLKCKNVISKICVANIVFIPYFIKIQGTIQNSL